MPIRKLTPADVRAIRAKAKRRAQIRDVLASMTNAAIAREYGVHESAIEHVLSYQNWRHVRDE